LAGLVASPTGQYRTCAAGRLASRPNGSSGALPQDGPERLHAGVDMNLSTLAQDLGYFDQAHFTRDFKQITGVSPGRY
jgi:AraC-like DNA-binding protein